VLNKLAAAAAITVSLVFVGAAFGGKASSSSITGPYIVAATAGASTIAPQFGDTITFNVSTTQTTNPFVNLVCSGNGVGYNSWAAFWPTSGTFILSSPGWPSGAADCTAKLVMYVTSSRYKVLASTSFHVGP
jgi:hypothetical protein